MLRRVGALLGLALMLSTSTATRAQVANRECANDQDVTIVVDFQSLGGGANVRCAPQPIKSGFDVFRRAEVSYETVQGSDFVCRIAGKPGPETEDCANTPPGDAYWSYWYAARGGDWKYSNSGPGARKPPPGSFEGWSFRGGDKAQPPRYPVPSRSASPDTPDTPDTPESPTTTTGVASPPGPSGAPAAPGSPGERSAASTPALAGTTTTAELVAMPTTTATSADATTTSLRLGSVDLSADTGDGGTSTGFILSAATVVALGVLAFVLLRLRAR
ncbi:MAG TPA: hypothetical protein VMZ22_11620 [Acidimicrobiales bacterium]|nr:hypothetical protein [Acidimicrobiales bacterium]